MVEIIAPIKVNLFLHVIGKDENNYHKLQSLVSFGDLGDIINITPSDKYNLEIIGEFSGSISKENNLITKAVNALCAATDNKPNIDIQLDKNIPLGAGLGGGSADAAAVIKALIEMWNIEIDEEKLGSILLKLGADVPMCFQQQTAFIEGIGEGITPIDYTTPIHAVLIYPNRHSNTKKVFAHYKTKFPPPIQFNFDGNIFDFLKGTQNDLTDAAITLYPEIKDALSALNHVPKCKISRMSGSGSCCFGLFENDEIAEEAYAQLVQSDPNWWIKKTVLNVI